jgi:transposase
MGKPYSRDLRERVVASVLEGGLSRNKAAAQFAVAVSTVVIWVQRYQETGSVAPGQMGGPKPKAIRGEHEAFLKQRVREGAFTLRGLVRELADHGLKVDYRSVWNFVHAEKLSFKKRMARPVRKGFLRSRLINLLQRIRPRRCSPGQDGDTRAPVLIKPSASSAVF